MSIRIMIFDTIFIICNAKSIIFIQNSSFLIQIATEHLPDRHAICLDTSGAQLQNQGERKGIQGKSKENHCKNKEKSRKSKAKVSKIALAAA